MRPGTGDLERSDSAMGAQDKFVLVAEKPDCNSMGLRQQPRKSQIAMLKREVHQLDTLPARKNTRGKEEQEQKKEKEKQ